MTHRKLSRILTVLLLILLFGGIFAYNWITGRLATQANTVANLKAEEKALEVQEQAYAKASAELEKYSSLKDQVEKIIPKNKDQAYTLAELYQISSEVGLEIQSIQFNTSNLGIVEPKPKATESEENSEEKDTTETEVAAPTITQVEPVEGMPGIYGMNLEVAFNSANPNLPITYGKIIAMLKKLELNRRTLQVSAVNIVPNETSIGGTFDFSLSLIVYIKP